MYNQGNISGVLGVGRMSYHSGARKISCCITRMTLVAWLRANHGSFKNTHQKQTDTKMKNAIAVMISPIYTVVFLVCSALFFFF